MQPELHDNAGAPGATIDFEQLVATAGDAMMVCDADNLIVYWNAASERMFGHTAAEVMGRSLDIIIPERQRARHRTGYDVTMSTGITKYGTTLLKVPALHKDGHTLSIAFTVSMLKDAAGSVQGVVAIIRDESARFAEDRALRGRLVELEQQAALAAQESHR